MKGNNFNLLFNSSYNNSHFYKFFPAFVLIALLSIHSLYKAKSDEIFLMCTGKYEINRGPLIKPDWETTYIKLNLNGLVSTVNNKGDMRRGTTVSKGDSYIITYKDSRNMLENIYKINRKYATYTVEFPKINRTLIGTCQKSRG
tara:strand:- start:190 stop:621 length:432 start_codon:yes stop_codon:yes gene_type:complete